jgi:hypothetical protein
MHKNHFMKVDEKDVERLNRSLSEKFRSGDKWVAYDDYNGSVSSGNVTTFKNITAANKYCESHTGDCGEGEFYYFRFKPIINVLKSLTGADSIQKSQPHLNKLDEQIQEHAVMVTAHNYDRPLVETLADGLYHPVELKQQILSWKDIDSYQVIEHYYPKGMIYEVGHGSKSHGDFPSYYEAQKCFEQLVDKHTSGTEFPELKLIGKIKGQELALDFEDFPQPGTGVLFKIANRVYAPHPEKRYEVNQQNQLDKPLDIHQRKMAKFNWIKSTLEFFDGALKKVLPNAKIDFLNFSSLSSRPVDIINPLKQAVTSDQQLTQGEKTQSQGLRFKPGL